ncbi:RNA-directed DNA polymerase, eukaryota, reverse transcriptase zinc-binding domain protein, partial [Tanacetum coccineum]
MNFMSLNVQGLAQKAKKDWVKELCIHNKVNFLSLQETKMEQVNLFCIKSCWGNFDFDFIVSPWVGNSGDILCVWDPNMFCKEHYTVSDYFIAVMGKWVPNGKNFLIISVYAPQELSEKKMLWQYLNHMIDRRKGDVIVMGDFNEVRSPDERFGSIFNTHGAAAFNNFISLGGLMEVPTGGYSYTWSHKSASKMSKLDGFLISEDFFNSCPNNSLELAQKAKIKWSIEGDENSKYFHGIINKQRNNIVIRGILVDGAWIEDPRIVKNEFFTHFKDRFNITSSKRLTLDMEFPNKLSFDQKTDLERPFTKEEIKGAVWDCGLNKSLGPDGFTFGFYQRYWSLLEPDIVDVVNHFFIDGFSSKGCNSSFISLIPKSHDAKQVKDFRPISLIGSLYKIIAKLLANRLVPVMGNLVNEVQYAFIDNRQILDGPFILNEILQWCKAKKKKTMLFKVDFEKAFDSIRWDFLDDVLKKFGFGERWCDWIQSCLRSSRGSILVNGSPTSEFQFHKGLKQGDPLSPFLFILIMESLHLSFQNVVNAGMFKGINLENSLHLSHLFYADDVVYVNLHKSKIMGIAVDSSIVDLAAADIGCMTLKSPFSYLGVKIGGRMRCNNSWEEIINKILSRLSKWKMKTLSIGGRLTLLKSVLGVMPIYYMSMFKVPKLVLKKMESIRSHVFKGVDLKDRKISLVKWENVLASKEKGGLGVSSFYALNRALIFKWIWRFRTQNSSLWARVIKAIHGMDGKVGCTPSASFSSNWIDIVQESRSLRDQDNVPLKYLFPRIYALESIKSITVAEKVSQPGLVSSLWRMPRGGIEQHQMADLCLNMEDTILPNMIDRWFWSLTGSGEFSVALARNFIDDHSLVDSAPKTRWSKTVSKKI